MSPPSVPASFGRPARPAPEAARRPRFEGLKASFAQVVARLGAARADRSCAVDDEETAMHSPCL